MCPGLSQSQLEEHTAAPAYTDVGGKLRGQSLCQAGHCGLAILQKNSEGTEERVLSDLARKVCSPAVGELRTVWVLSVNGIP